MKIEDPQKRLDMFWGKVDKKHIALIKEHIKGKRVLDMGCGYGTTTSVLTAEGYQCVGIDYDDSSVAAAKDRFPNCNFQKANAEELPFENNSFDAIVLRDALHHFYGEANFEKVKSEILRVAGPGANIIFFDPNVNFILRTMRKISKHKDEECDYETAVKIMKDMGFRIIHSKFNTLYSLPLSGGYVGINFVPGIKIIQTIILQSEKLFERLVNTLGLGRYLCWRYVLVGEKIK
jgi:SAM-dependent methyltransferase